MSTLLEPGECVRWKHAGGWKVGRVLTHFWDNFDDWYVVQCSDGVYRINLDDDEWERQPMRAEWEGKE